jgi:hypothetical protein
MLKRFHKVHTKCVGATFHAAAKMYRHLAFQFIMLVLAPLYVAADCPDKDIRCRILVAQNNLQASTRVVVACHAAGDRVITLMSGLACMKLDIPVQSSASRQ